ncbi:MAG: phosphoenolpyruvate carboxykinase (ATP), partial [Acidimicrobiia bacterium]|nr:phosphoenolpyruvate carboxykinase (ATP) [Acidimicrobiia bacterium]
MRDLRRHGIEPTGEVYWDMASPELIEHTISRGLGEFSDAGSLVVDTTPYTGRSPNDKFIVRRPGSEPDIWWGSVNVAMEPEVFDALYDRVVEYLGGVDLYVQDMYAGADAEFRLPVRVISESPWHSLFARNMFILRPPSAAHVDPGFTVVHAPNFEADRERDGTNSEAFIIVDFEREVILIGGTKYAGEVKKSIFTIMNYLLPKRGVLSLHSSATVGPNGDSTVYFGLSGTGKTTLS